MARGPELGQIVQNLYDLRPPRRPCRFHLGSDVLAPDKLTRREAA
jgi:hypothetical protein